MNATVEQPCWACTRPPIYIGGSGTKPQLCASCAAYVHGKPLAGVRITTLSPKQSASPPATQSPPSVTPPRAPDAPDGDADISLTEAARAERAREPGCMCPGTFVHPKCPLHEGIFPRGGDKP
jgi:hypothetical protein